MQIILVILLIITLLLTLTIIYLIDKKSRIKKTPQEENKDYSDLFEEIKKKKTKKHLND